ncbi:MAG TPA: DUF4846 domain-containing protein [Hymenobacter sp.]|uniref:DUF4846 domain-containing protein n=1 Tax=Hymenobacter sp. TaxID=1898978 RepID=UPI002ED82963
MRANSFYCFFAALPLLLLARHPAPEFQLPSGCSYPWLKQPAKASESLAVRFPVPAGCRRVAVASGSWGEWLRYLPLLPAGTKARLFNGGLKDRQDVVAGVVNIDIGSKDLQQCADAVIRLRAEYLFSHDPNKVHFHLTTGYDFWFSDFVAGKTFKVNGEEVTPATRPAEAPTHAALGRYLVPTFGYAGTKSLSRELTAKPLTAVEPGDVFVHGGAPGHAVLVVDVAENPATHQKFMLLAQSYMPAQNIHVLRDTWGASAWMPVQAAEGVVSTPEWDFEASELKRF